ncbi:hypothetical protein [Bacillus phage DZ1]|uniref:Uncharacterized protein n=1 Tax=Bacillus phage DZ1 TaxID=3075862 RepID=A0AA96IYG5_9CAUD|nr:hypothetical protein [Bacillus phage DZ1]
MMKTNEMVKAKMEIINQFENIEGCKVILKVEEYDGEFVIEGDAWDADGEYVTDFELSHKFTNWKHASMACNMLTNKLAKEDFDSVEYAR